MSKAQNGYLIKILRICISFLPEALLAYGYCHRLCLCVCVSVCVSPFFCQDDNSSHVPARITWFGRNYAKHFASGPYCFGCWLSLAFHVKFDFILKFCLFASLLRIWNICETCKKRSLLNCSTSHMVPHTFWFLYMHTDRVVPRTVKHSSNISLWDHRSGSPRLGDRQWILQAAVGFRQITLPSHTDILKKKHRQSPKQL